jgi:hypothetical protein
MNCRAGIFFPCISDQRRAAYCRTSHTRKNCATCTGDDHRGPRPPVPRLRSAGSARLPRGASFEPSSLRRLSGDRDRLASRGTRSRGPRRHVSQNPRGMTLSRDRSTSCRAVADLRSMPTHSPETERSDSSPRVRPARSMKLELVRAVHAALAGVRISKYSRRGRQRSNGARFPACAAGR